MRLLSVMDSLGTLGPVLVDAAIRGTVAFGGALALTWMLRRQNAALRHMIWVGAVLVQLLLPVFALWGPKWSVAVPAMLAGALPAPAPTVPVNTLERTPQPTTSVEVQSDAPAAPRAQAPAPAATSEAPRLSWSQLLIAVWACGALVILLRLAIGTTIVARLARRGNRIDDGSWLSLAQRLSTSLGIDRPLTLLRGNSLGVPVTWGIVYPVVLLPDDADAWSEDRRRFVLVHEMAHVKRFDALTQLAGQLALALFWFNPLVWVANRRMQLEREHACDDYVLRSGTAPSMYAEELLTMVRSLGDDTRRSAQPAFAALAMARRSEFEGRMLSILDAKVDRHPVSKARTALSAAAALLLVVPLAALQPYRKAREDHHVAARQDSVSMASLRKAVAERGKDLAEVGRGKDSVKKSLDAFPESFKINIMSSDDAALKAEPKAVVTAPAATAPAAPAKSATLYDRRSCGAVSSSSSISSHLHAENEDDGSVVISYLSNGGGRCIVATIIGKPTFSPDEDDIVALPPGSQASFMERTDAGEREVTFLAASGGMPPRTYRRDGVEQPFENEGRQWFAVFLPKILTESGLNVPARVAKWRRQGGVDEVLRQITKVQGTSARRTLYATLLNGGSLADAELDRIIRSASENLTGSSSDLRSILSRVGPKAQFSAQTKSAIERAMTGITSSGDRAALAMVYGQTDDRDMLLAVMRVTCTISSSGDRARVLVTLAPRYLARQDNDLEKAWFNALEGLPSSGDQRNALMVAIRTAGNTASVAKRIMGAARQMTSSGDMSAVLIGVLNAGAITTKDLRDAFYDAAAGVPSDGDRARVLMAASNVLK